MQQSYTLVCTFILIKLLIAWSNIPLVSPTSRSNITSEQIWLMVPTVRHTRKRLNWTCGEDHVLGDEFVVHDGELGQFDSLHPWNRSISPSPIKLNVVCGVSIWKYTHTCVTTNSENTQTPTAAQFVLTWNHFSSSYYYYVSCFLLKW